MRIEVDEDPLVRTRRGYHPRASLRGGIRHGVSGRGEVVGVWDSDVASTFVCGEEEEEAMKTSGLKQRHLTFWLILSRFSRQLRPTEQLLLSVFRQTGPPRTSSLYLTSIYLQHNFNTTRVTFTVVTLVTQWMFLSEYKRFWLAVLAQRDSFHWGKTQKFPTLNPEEQEQLPGQLRL